MKRRAALSSSTSSSFVVVVMSLLHVHGDDVESLVLATPSLLCSACCLASAHKGGGGDTTHMAFNSICFVVLFFFIYNLFLSPVSTFLQEWILLPYSRVVCTVWPTLRLVASAEDFIGSLGVIIPICPLQDLKVAVIVSTFSL